MRIFLLLAWLSLMYVRCDPKVTRREIDKLRRSFQTVKLVNVD